MWNRDHQRRGNGAPVRPEPPPADDARPSQARGNSTPEKRRGFDYESLPPAQSAPAAQQQQPGAQASASTPSPAKDTTVLKLLGVVGHYEAEVSVPWHRGMELIDLVERLYQQGFEPRPRALVYERTPGTPENPEGVPICPRHGVPMRLRDKQGDQWWSHNVGSGHQEIWCKGRPGKDSPGWDYEEDES